ncbi:hypothetical protein NP233_g8201 [Leucocoprinus birnbaumii]|uniref:Glycoside hydrolase family 16 protein n=1 Tax=Leucocoprinus birnbaumii TaxID=56174 RepID=A0AAD5YND0_9AGAR|nr:hypothetical protein NP233_g8201 [Leucocoprinus birnbaumii]
MLNLFVARFVTAAQAAQDRLAYVDSTTNHAIIKVDNTSTVVYPNKRNTVRIQTNDLFPIGSVWVVDMLHVPYGCSVWPAFWSKAPTWPDGGEIDTFEGINMVQNNQMTLHTNPGCRQVQPEQTTLNSTSTDCSFQANNNSGCVVTDPDTTSYGAAFANAGGGVWVTEFAESGISIWFMPRAKVPSGISSNSPTIDTSALGIPTANWPTGGCPMNTFFSAQNIVFDITLCGDLARPPNIFTQTCTGVCYNDWVLGNGTHYSTAYFEIASLRVFSQPGSPGSTTTTTPNSAPDFLSTSKGLLTYAVTMLGVGLIGWLFGL